MQAQMHIMSPSQYIPPLLGLSKVFCITVHVSVQALTQKESVAKKKAAMSGDIAKALARLSSGLYVVTADNKGAKGAMVRTHLTLLRRLFEEGLRRDTENAL